VFGLVVFLIHVLAENLILSKIQRNDEWSCYQEFVSLKFHNQAQFLQESKNVGIENKAIE